MGKRLAVMVPAGAKAETERMVAEVAASVAVGTVARQVGWRVVTDAVAEGAMASTAEGAGQWEETAVAPRGGAVLGAAVGGTV